MQSENLNRQQIRQPALDTVMSVCQAGVLETTITIPSTLSSKPPLLALHGISRNATELTQTFAMAAEAAGRIVVVPHFMAGNWPVFQRITRHARPDKALLALMSTLRTMDSAFHGPMEVFGFSGGAQLAHRFAMLYPEAVGDLHLGAAGWYTLPEQAVTYPYGIGDAREKPEPWSRLMRSGLHSYLQRNISVYVGACDTKRDMSLRQNAQVDSYQGANRLERAGSYVASINRSQAAQGLPCTATLEVLPDCDHDLNTCTAKGSLALRVLAG